MVSQAVSRFLEIVGKTAKVSISLIALGSVFFCIGCGGGGGTGSDNPVETASWNGHAMYYRENYPEYLPMASRMTLVALFDRDTSRTDLKWH